MMALQWKIIRFCQMKLHTAKYGNTCCRANYFFGRNHRTCSWAAIHACKYNSNTQKYPLRPIFVRSKIPATTKDYLSMDNQHLSTLSGMNFTTKYSTIQVSKKAHRLAEKALANANVSGETEFPVKIENAVQVAQFLLDQDFPDKNIFNFLSKYSGVLPLNIKDMEKTIETLSDLGFRKQGILGLVVEAAGKKNMISGITYLLDVLQGIGFLNRQKYKIIELAPEIFQIENPSKHILAVINVLMECFAKADVFELIMANPSILLLSETDVTEKCVFVLGDMKIEKKEALDSNFLAYPTAFLETRFQFLIRSGGYEIPKKRMSATEENPVFKKIVDTGNKYFAKNVAGLTLKEYLTFVKIIDQERSNKEELYGHSDSE